MKEIRNEYKQGRKKFQVREYNGLYFLEKITKACGFTVYCGTKEEMDKYLEKNSYKFIGLIVM